MMRLPKCPDHGQLLAEYALGRLDDREAERAQQVLDGCAHCAEWWAATFETSDYAALDAAVDEVFADFSAPHRRRNGWWAAAAAAAAVAGLGVLYHAGSGLERTAPANTAAVHSASDEVITTLDFESGRTATAVKPEAITTFDFESGTTSDKIASMDFESGSLDGRTPST